MSYTVILTTALGRTFSREVSTLDEVRQIIDSTHMVRSVDVIDSTTGEQWAPQRIDALLNDEALV